MKRVIVMSLFVMTLGGWVWADVFECVPVARQERYVVVYELDIPVKNRFNQQGVPYTIDRSGEIPAGSFDRVAYFLELEKEGKVRWVWVSFTPDVDDPAKLGVPHKPEYKRQRLIQNLEIFSSPESGVTPGKVDQGNIEFWPDNYGGDGEIVPNFDEGRHGIDDKPQGGGNYGSMQVHNYQAREVLFAFNHWNSGGLADVGIGNKGSGNKDWTFSKNANKFSRRLLQVLVRPRSAKQSNVLETFYLKPAGSTPIGPVTYREGRTFSLLGTEFTIHKIQRTEKRSRFIVRSTRTQKSYGPFENHEGNSVRLGGVRLRMSEWQ